MAQQVLPHVDQSRAEAGFDVYRDLKREDLNVHIG